MSLTNGEGLSPADIAAVTGNNGGFGDFGGGAWWIVILLLFAFGGGWGNGYGNGGGVPFMESSVQRGFDQSAVMGGLSGIQNAIVSGAGDLQLGIAGINQNIAQMGYNMSSQFANCCCENRLGIANLGAEVAREACADRAAYAEGLRDVITATQAQTQAILDKMCQQEIDAKNTEIANLRTQLNMQNLAASQAAQTAQLIADNTAQTQYVVNRIAPYPVPSYNVPNPYAYNGGTCACGFTA